MTTNSQLSTTEPKTKQLEWEQIHRNGEHKEGYQWGAEWGERGKSYREEEA